MIQEYPLNWAIESIDFSSLVQGDFSKEPVPSMLNNCSAADTLSTAGESSSESLVLEEGESSSISSEYDSSSSSSITPQHHQSLSLATRIEATIIEEDEDDDDDDGEGSSSIDLEESESSLDLSDLKAFAQEDECGIYHPERRDTLPPPRVRTNYKGDSQCSFTLEDLEGPLEGTSSSTSPSPSPSSPLDDRNNDDSMSPFDDQEQPQQKKKPLQGILKNGFKKDIKRTPSFAIQMMERASMMNLSLDGTFDFEGFEDDDNDYNHNDDSASNSCNLNGWDMMQQSFAAEDIGALDLQALEEKGVSFGSVCVHEHPLMAGNNPSVSEGVPLCLAWQAKSSRTFSSLDAYEKSREKGRSHHPRQHQHQQQPSRRPARKIEAEERMWMLINAGVSLKEIQHAEMMTNIARDEREATKQQHLLLCAKESAAFIRAIRAKEEEEEEWRGQQQHQRRRGRTLSLSQNNNETRESRPLLVVSPERSLTSTAHSA